VHVLVFYPLLKQIIYLIVTISVRHKTKQTADYSYYN